ncbi:MAG TPA: DUF4097 family beta strand repeat-containing protein [Opitutus sp.]|nr:DUF4097 family beta strand repeat-containing protein [Opitutus sp.]
MKLLPLLALAFVSAAALRADDYAFKESFIRSGAFKPGGEISLENINGNIEVRTWDKNEILIEGEKSAKTDEELKLIELTIDLTDSAANIKVHLPKRDGFWSNNIRAAVRFTLTIPATATLQHISSVNGSVDLADVRGTANISSVNGQIRARDLAADARLHTVNGSIHASFSTVTAKQSVSCETVNGSVHVAVPKDAGFALHAHTVNGGIHCAFPITLGDKGRHSLSGTIGDGRADLSARSVNGSVHIESL